MNQRFIAKDTTCCLRLSFCSLCLGLPVGYGSDQASLSDSHALSLSLLAVRDGAPRLLHRFGSHFSHRLDGAKQFLENALLSDFLGRGATATTPSPPCPPPRQRPDAPPDPSRPHRLPQPLRSAILDCASRVCVFAVWEACDGRSDQWRNALYYEVRESKLSAVHCVNTVLRGPFFSEFDFAALASISIGRSADDDPSSGDFTRFGGATDESHNVSMGGDFVSVSTIYLMFLDLVICLCLMMFLIVFEFAKVVVVDF
ncbi:hypothetical protein Scep_010234 [Stephania cephalantha]|uniref:Uncharacterized protein n=1 Tax=Stephania cephalantha TaxID=152367 RepID=A0AAP0JVZ3_9MAGN